MLLCQYFFSSSFYFSCSASANDCLAVFVWVFEIIYSNSISAFFLPNSLYSNGNFQHPTERQFSPHHISLSLTLYTCMNGAFRFCLFSISLFVVASHSTRFGLLPRVYRKFAQSECDEWIAFDRLPLFDCDSPIPSTKNKMRFQMKSDYWLMWWYHDSMLEKEKKNWRCRYTIEWIQTPPIEMPKSNLTQM